MTKLSVNVNKIALLRNARGGNLPDLAHIVRDCERWGAQGITVHPRPDQRHVRYDDIPQLKEIITTEFNIEGNPKVAAFRKLVLRHKPTQCTLVPDSDDALTSNQGWDTQAHASFLRDVVAELQAQGIRVSIFVDPLESAIEGAKAVGADRIELYTEAYAKLGDAGPYAACAELAYQLGLGVNAGHDLNADNLRFFYQHVPHLLEVSIGHALICDALLIGLQQTISTYRACLQTNG